MVGAFLVAFILALVFLTRPNKRRDKYVSKLYHKLKKSPRKNFASKKSSVATPEPLPVRINSKAHIISLDVPAYHSLLLQKQQRIQTDFKTGSPIEEKKTATDGEEFKDTNPELNKLVQSLKSPIENDDQRNSLINDFPSSAANTLVDKKLELIEIHPESIIKEPLIDETELNLEETNIDCGIDVDESIIDFEQTYQTVDYVEREIVVPISDQISAAEPNAWIPTENTHSELNKLMQSLGSRIENDVQGDTLTSDFPLSDANTVVDNYSELTEKHPEPIIEKPLIDETEINLEEINSEFSIDADESIIDIEQTYQPIDYIEQEIQENFAVPEWHHSYIYSYTDLERASTQQIKFYNKLKEKFLRGGWIDIGTNSNYAFILMFNLLRDFNTHQDIKLLEEQFNRLGSYFPKTAPYANRFLIQKMRDIGDTEGLGRLEWTIVNNRIDYQSWDWRQRYVKRLGLSKSDAKLLDDFYPPSNTFLWNDFCATEVIKLYIQLRKELQIAYKNNKIDQSVQFAQFLDILARKQYNYRVGSQNYQYTIGHGTTTIWECLFKYCEAKVKKLYAFTKTFIFLTNYDSEVLASFNQLILSFVEHRIDELMKAVALPTEELEIELNTSITTRWKVSFNLSEAYYNEFGKEAFETRAVEILRLNAKNPSVELIHLEISKNLMHCDKQLSFDHFLKYTGQNLKSNRLVLKLMSQKMDKKLFTTPEQRAVYSMLMTQLIRNEISINDALVQIKDFYIPKRKKITLDTQAIKTAEVEHTGTVELLNEYLKDDDATFNEIPVSTVDETVSESNSYKFDASPTEVALITFFKEHHFILNTEQLTLFCKEKGAMAGPLLNNLNETCYELLDDLLIEQEADIYSINPTYYTQITKL